MRIRHTMIAVALAALLHLSVFAQNRFSGNADVIAIDIKSDDSGHALYGTMKYSTKGSASTTVGLPLFWLSSYLSVGIWKEGKDADGIGSDQVDLARFLRPGVIVY